MTKQEIETVGHGKPPQQHQFRPGQSGNPNGRPKGVRNFKTDFRDELNETISLREDGRDIAISKQRALIKRLVALAIGGDARAMNSVLAFCARAFGDETDDEQQAPEDREIVNAFARGRAKRRGANSTVSSSKSKEVDHG
jgi:hypothetical protein